MADSAAVAAVKAEFEEFKKTQAAVNADLMNKLEEILTAIKTAAPKKRANKTQRSTGTSTGELPSSDGPGANSLQFIKNQFATDKTAFVAKYGIAADIVTTAENDPSVAQKTGVPRAKAEGALVWKKLGDDIKNAIKKDWQSARDAHANRTKTEQVPEANTATEAK